jgi:hypothetical protein
MSKLSPILRGAADAAGSRIFVFQCPGCGDRHQIPVEGANAWGWNGSVDKPTFTPSILVRCGHYAPHHEPGGGCWCTWKDEDGEASGFNCYVCHSFVTDGRIAFCSDSTHALAGQTVDLPEFGQ